MVDPRGRAADKSEHRSKSRKNSRENGPAHREGKSPRALSSEPLRQEAERGWEESDRSAAKGIRRRSKKAEAHKRRRERSGAKDDVIARLSERVDQLERQLAEHLAAHSEQ